MIKNRQFIKWLVLPTLVLLLVANVHGETAAPQAGMITAVSTHFERDGQRFTIKGTNYYPKDYPWESFWPNFDTALPQMEAELALAKTFDINTVRIFIHYDYFDGDPANAGHVAHLQELVELIAAHDMVVIVTLFDLYPSYSPAAYNASDYAASKVHIDTVVNALGINNPHILGYDIKNEIDSDYDASAGEAAVKAWLSEMLAYMSTAAPNHLLTVGFLGGATGNRCDGQANNISIYDPTIAAAFASEVDFVSVHYPFYEGCFYGDMGTLQTAVGNKPVVLEEFGIHTVANPPDPCFVPSCTFAYSERDQAALYSTLLSMGEAHGLAGFLFWTLNDFDEVLPGANEKEHCFGILRNNNVGTKCYVPNPTDYTEKDSAALIRRHYRPQVHYLDEFVGWIASLTPQPPGGWSDNFSSPNPGATMRPYHATDTFWSNTEGAAAITKFGGTNDIGEALSPVLNDFDVDLAPILTGRIIDYAIRDTMFGKDGNLHIGVKEGGTTTRLLTITPATMLPLTFHLDLRDAPLNWSGTKDFQISLELTSTDGTHAYSAAYELSWIGLVSGNLDLVGAISHDGSNVTVQWPEVVGITSYKLWRQADTPYFNPADGQASVLEMIANIEAGFMSDVDMGSGLGQTAVNHYYLIEALDAAGASLGTSQHMGEFTFAVVPGS
ncbi:MAG: cellulase family glycosylhydrolase [Chloroflexota bacterium]